MPAPSPEIAPSPAPSPVARPLQWPSWFPGVDSTLAGLTLVLAFMAASFVARNSDLWLHLAAGKRLFAGEYIPGSDPFSYSAADRAWVNHSWLLDAVAYLLYGGKGAVLIGAKALVVALAFGVLLAIRRPKFPLWPWAATACIAVLACAPYFTLRPLVVSMLFLAVTLLLLFRMPHKPGSWRFPFAIGVTFWLWANCDVWFFLGPLALALLILGDLIQTYVLNSPEEPNADPDAEPLGQLPDLATLGKALAIGVLACVLTPHHVRVWMLWNELPFELIGPSVAEADPRLRTLFYTPFTELYRSHAGLGYNLNGLAYASLFVLGAGLLGFGVGRVRVAHVALWIGFAGLSLLSIYAIPFFAIVAVPLVAAQLNALSTRVKLQTWGDPKSRLLLLGSAAGRILCVLAVGALCVLAYPGWVHPESANPVYARRVAWEVEPDPALVQAAEQLNQWRESGKLPAEARGMITHTDLANYVAWYAPREKVFFNARYNHHRPEVADFVAVRKGLGLIATRDEPPNLKDAADVFGKWNSEYLAVYAAPGDGTLRGRAYSAMMELYLRWGEFSPWYLDGQTTVYGWHPTMEEGKPTFAALRVDPLVLAFGPAVARLPQSELKPPLAPVGWEEAFVRPARPSPPGAAEALGWLDYKKAVRARQQLRVTLSEQWFFGVPTLTNPSLHRVGMWAANTREFGPLPFPPDAKSTATAPNAAADDAAMQAIPFLAVRAARRAIAADPDHPDGYLALGAALGDPELPLSASERTLGRVTAYRQCLSRLPAPERYKRGQFLASASDVARGLAALYLNPVPRMNPATGRATLAFLGMPVDAAPLGELMIGEMMIELPNGQVLPASVAERAGLKPPPGTRVVPYLLPLDIARETLLLAKQYAQAEQVDGGEAAQRSLEELENFLKLVENEIIPHNNSYERRKATTQKLPELVASARQNALVGEAIRLLTDGPPDLSKEFERGSLFAALQAAALQLAVGRLEDAANYLDKLTTEFDRIAAIPAQAQALGEPQLRPALRMLNFQKLVLSGDYKAAGELWESLAGTRVEELKKLQPLGPTVPMPVVLSAIGLRGKAMSENELKAELEKLIRPPVPVMPTLAQPLALRLWLGEWLSLNQVLRQQISGELEREASFYYRRGVLSLFEGDIPTAKTRFQQAFRKPPEGWNLRNLDPPEANHYLRLLEMAAKAAGP